MGIFNLRGVLSAVALSVVMGSTAASAAVVDLYQITVKGTFQSEVDDPVRPATLTSDPVFSPAFGKSIELVFSMPLDSLPTFVFSTIENYDTAVAGQFNGTGLTPNSGFADGQLSLNLSASRNSVALFTRVEADPFGLGDFDVGVTASIVVSDSDGTGLSLVNGLPLYLGSSIFEEQSFQVSAARRDASGGIEGFQGYASIDSISVDVISPATVPLPASALLLGVGLAGLGALRRRRRAA